MTIYICKLLIFRCNIKVESCCLRQSKIFIKLLRILCHPKFTQKNAVFAAPSCVCRETLQCKIWVGDRQKNGTSFWILKDAFEYGWREMVIIRGIPVRVRIDYNGMAPMLCGVEPDIALINCRKLLKFQFLFLNLQLRLLFCPV